MAVGESYNVEARRRAREAVQGPGKFEGEQPITAILYEISMNGGYDESAQTGETSRAERYGRHLLYEDSQGFVTSERADTVAEAEAHITFLNAQDDES